MSISEEIEELNRKIKDLDVTKIKLVEQRESLYRELEFVCPAEIDMPLLKGLACNAKDKIKNLTYINVTGWDNEAYNEHSYDVCGLVICNKCGCESRLAKESEFYRPYFKEVINRRQ